MSTKSSTLKWFFGAAVIAIAIAAGAMLKLGDSVVYFYTPNEALAKAAELGSKNIKIGGMVKAGSVVNNVETHDVAFTLTDMQDVNIQVSYHGTPPDMFKENQGVVVEGRLTPDGKTFTAQTLLVKHSEEYKKPEAGHSINKELMEKSLFQDATATPSPQ